MLVNDQLHSLNTNQTSRLDICLCGFLTLVILLGCYIYLIPLLIGAGINYILTKLDYNFCDNLVYWCYPLLGLGVYLILLLILIIFICSIICLAKILNCFLTKDNKYTKVDIEQNDYVENFDGVEPVEELFYPQDQ